MKENFIYMMKNWISWDRKSLIYFVIRVPALVFLPIITAYIPKAMIDCIEQGVTVGRLTLVVASLSVLVVLTTWLDPFMKELINGGARIIRMRYAMAAFDKNLNAPYVQIESLKGREMNERAEEFYRSYHSAGASFIEILNQVCICVVGIIASVTLIYKINFVVIAIILISCAAEFLLLSFLNKRELETRDERSRVFTKLHYFYSQAKNFDSAKDVRLYGFSDRFIKTMAQLVWECEKNVSYYARVSAADGGARALLNLIRELVAYAYLTYLVVKGRLSVSDFIFYFGIITGFSSWILNLVYSWSGLERCCNDCQKFRDYVESEKQENDISADFEDVSSVEFKNVSFAYPEAETNTIKNMSFKVKRGENIAIVGENGAGKTTVVKLLCGLYEITQGEILINGQKKSGFNLFAPVFQDYVFLPMTIAQNIAADTEYDRERLYDAFDKAGITEKINSLKNKENTYMVKDVYKDAVDFSGGEKQKLLLAKAIYKNAPVLILDEPTAALDPIAENELYLKYNEMTEGKISFFISHRLSSTRFCDRILFISDGIIAESGSHEELMAKKGKYYRMYQLQSYYYKEGGAV